jgi:hypothetical protein
MQQKYWIKINTLAQDKIGKLILKHDGMALFCVKMIDRRIYILDQESTKIFSNIKYIYLKI